MAARHPRLGVSRDPDVERALALTGPLLDPDETRSAAAQIRALTLRGAEAVLAGAGSEARLRGQLTTKYELIPARVDHRTIPAPLGDVDDNDPTPASDALKWVRGE